MYRRWIASFVAVALLMSMGAAAFAASGDRLNALAVRAMVVHDPSVMGNANHHDHQHGKSGGKLAHGANCCLIACTPAIIAAVATDVVDRRYTDRYTFSNTSLIASIFGDPPLRPPRSAAA